jgi:pimeloyl-ACP methyl ester carboxylesterase
MPSIVSVRKVLASITLWLFATTASAETAYIYADIGGGKIFYREAGERTKPLLLMLHGFPSSSHQFRDVIPALASRFHVVAPDLPGMGRSDALPAATPVTFTLLSERIEALIETLGGKRIIF